MNILALAGLAVTSALLLPGSATAQTLRDLSVVQTQAYQAGKPASGSLSLLTLLDRSDATYALGEAVRLSVKVNADAYITVLNIGASGRVIRLFPNEAQPNNRVRAGEAVEVPSAASGAKITVQGPVGAELIKVIATSKPLNVIREDQLQGSGMFRTLTGDVGALERDLAVVTETAPAGTDVAVVNQIVKTIPARGVTAPVIGGQESVRPPVVAENQVTVLPTAAAPSQPSAFPLLLAADKASYRTGERLVLAVTPMEACYLTVLSTNAGGQVRQLYPTRALPSSRISAQQTVLLSGGSSPQTVLAAGPGADTITADCSRDVKPGRFARSAEEIMPQQEQEELQRSLSLGPYTQSSQTVGHARLTISVAP